MADKNAQFIDEAGLKSYDVGIRKWVEENGGSMDPEELQKYLTENGYAKKTDIPKNTSDLNNNSGFLTSHQSLADYSKVADTVTDVSTSGNNVTVTKNGKTTTLTVPYATAAGSAPASDVPAWAKAASKPSYSYSEISGTPAAVTETTVSGWGFTKNGGTVTQVKVGTSAYNPTSGVISLPAYPTSLPASDVQAWAKAANKPSYSYSEITGTPAAVTETTVTGWGFTKNAGTVTQVKIGTTAYNPTSGVITLPAYPTTLPASDVPAWAKAASKPS